MTDMNFHGIKAVDKYYLFDFPPKDGEYREGVQVVYDTGEWRGKLTLVMVDSEMDSAYKLNVKDMAQSSTFLGLLNDADKELIIRLSRLTEEEINFLDIEKRAHNFNDFMNRNWDEAIYEHAAQGNDWQPKLYQDYFTVWSYAKRNGQEIPYQGITYPSPHQALDYVNKHHNSANTKLIISHGMSL